MVTEILKEEILKMDSANLSVEVRILLAILITEQQILVEMKRNRQAYQRKKKNEPKHEPETPGYNDDQ